MKYFILSIFLITGITYSCKKNSPAKSVSKTEVKTKDSTSMVTKDTMQLDSAKSAMMNMLPINTVPVVGKQNWAFVFDKTKEHTAGIFRLWTEDQWRELLASMDYASEEEIKNSFAFEPKADWWVKRDIKKKVLNHEVGTYKKKEGKSTWFFGFNKNKEIYFWK